MFFVPGGNEFEKPHLYRSHDGRMVGGEDRINPWSHQTAPLAATGSGKSFLLNFLLTHFQKYEPLTYIFDLGGSYENLTRLFGGTYLPVGMQQRSFMINPFTLPPTPENLQFLFSFLKVLIESSAYQMTAQDERDLYEQIENLYAIEPAQRRLFT